MVEDICKFLKEAFCIDGDATFVREPITVDGHFVLTDSKRGKLAVSWTKLPQEDKAIKPLSSEDQEEREEILTKPLEVQPT